MAKKTVKKKTVKKTVKKKTKTGRPRKEISKADIDYWAGLQATGTEVCAMLEIDRGTLNSRIKEWTGGKYTCFSAYFEEKREGGRCKLREIQMNLAKTAPAVAIFLGKNYLGQKDVVTVEDTRDESLKDKTIKELQEELTALEKSKNDK